MEHNNSAHVWRNTKAPSEVKIKILFSPCTASHPATPSTGTELPSWETERLNINTSLWKPGTRPPHASTRPWTLIQATRLCASNGGGERVDDHHRFPISQALMPALHYLHPPPFSPAYHTFINFVSPTHTLLFTLFTKHKYFTNYYAVYFNIILVPNHKFTAFPNLASFPPNLQKNR